MSWFLILIYHIIEEIMAHDSKKATVIVLQLIEVCVFDGIEDLVFECLIHCYRIILDYL